MSLVGPRPLILDDDQHVREWARERLSLRPGITGPWQVLGRSGIPFEEMVRLDYLYVTGWSLFGDFKLILRTIPRITREVVPRGRSRMMLLISQAGWLASPAVSEPRLRREYGHTTRPLG